MSPPVEVEAILPCHPGIREGFELVRARVCVESLKASGALRTVGLVNLVVPDPYSSRVAEFFSDLEQVRVVPESEMLSASELETLAGPNSWYKQQIIKLAANRCIVAPVTLTLDSDVVCVNNFTRDDVLTASKIVYQRHRQPRNWIETTFNYIGLEPFYETMGVTPAFLSTAQLVVVQGYIAHNLRLGADDASDWVRVLCLALKSGNSWTEYLLYQGILTKLGIWDYVHAPTVGSTRILEGFWAALEPDDETVERILSKKPYFVVAQSINKQWRQFHSALHQRGYYSADNLSSHYIQEAQAISSAKS
jgi:hypothetical protein